MGRSRRARGRRRAGRANLCANRRNNGRTGDGCSCWRDRCRGCRALGWRLRLFRRWARLLGLRRCGLCLLGFSLGFFYRQSREVPPHELGMRIVDRARVRFLLDHANFRQILDQDFRLDLEFPGEFVYSDLIGICHQPLSLQNSLESTSLRDLPTLRLLRRLQLIGAEFPHPLVPWYPPYQASPRRPSPARCLPRALQTTLVARRLRPLQMPRRSRERLPLHPDLPASRNSLRSRLPRSPPTRPAGPEEQLPAFRELRSTPPPIGESFQPSSRRCPEFPQAAPGSY